MNMASSRTQQEIEQDILNIEHALTTVSEIRSSLRHFVSTVKTIPSQPSFIHQFSEGLNKIKRDLNRQTVEVEQLKGALEYAQQVSQVNAFDWPAITEFMANEMVNQRAPDTDIKLKSEAGSLVKKEVDNLFSDLSSIVLERSPGATMSSDFITSHFNQWMDRDKHRRTTISGVFLQPEKSTVTGSTCSLKVITATLDLEYHHTSNSLIIHRYEIKGPKEDKLFWQESKYNVFQKINLVAAKAFENMTVLSAREALISLLDWLSSYHHLFTEPCCRCHKRLQYDSPQYKHLPPVVRTWAHQQKDNHENNVTASAVSTSNTSESGRNETPTTEHNVPGLAYHLKCFTGKM